MTTLSSVAYQHTESIIIPRQSPDFNDNENSIYIKVTERKAAGVPVGHWIDIFVPDASYTAWMEWSQSSISLTNNSCCWYRGIPYNLHHRINYIYIYILRTCFWSWVICIIVFIYSFNEYIIIDIYITLSNTTGVSRSELAYKALIYWVFDNTLDNSALIFLILLAAICTTQTRTTWSSGPIQPQYITTEVVFFWPLDMSLRRREMTVIAFRFAGQSSVYSTVCSD